jgi:hypothetical protein
MNIPGLTNGTIVKLNDINGDCYTIIGTSTLDTTNIIYSNTYSNCNDCLGIIPTPTPTPTPQTQYYDLYRCDNSGGDRAKMDGFPNLGNGTVVKANDGQCYTITGTSTDYTTNIINSTHYNCNDCLGIVPTPTPTSNCGGWEFYQYICVDCIKKIRQKRQFCDSYQIIDDIGDSCPQPTLSISVCYDGYDNGNDLFTVNVTKNNNIEPFTSEYFDLWYWDNGYITRINDANGFVSDNSNTPIYLSNPSLNRDIIAFIYPPCLGIHSSNIVTISYDNPRC